MLFLQVCATVVDKQSQQIGLQQIGGDWHSNFCGNELRKLKSVEKHISGIFPLIFLYPPNFWLI